MKEFVVGELVVPMPNPVGWSMYSQPDPDTFMYGLRWDGKEEMTGTVVEVFLSPLGYRFYKLLTSKGQTGWVLPGFISKIAL